MELYNHYNYNFVKVMDYHILNFWLLDIKVFLFFPM